MLENLKKEKKTENKKNKNPKRESTCGKKQPRFSFSGRRLKDDSSFPRTHGTRSLSLSRTHAHTHTHTRASANRNNHGQAQAHT